MVFLIGVDHIIQHDGFLWPAKAQAIEHFSEFLTKKVQDLSIAFLAEEFSEEALEKSSASTSTVGAVASELGVEYRLCDPMSRQRKEQGISDDDRREEFWLQSLKDALNRNILFICGESHLATFRQKLLSQGVPAEIVSKGWGRELIPNNAQHCATPGR